MRRRYVHLLLLLAMLGSTLARPAHAGVAPPQSAAPPSAITSAASEQKVPPGTIVAPVTEPSPLSAPLRAPARATAAGPEAGGWASYYGTRGGQLYLEPDSPTFEQSVNGPALAVGSWRTSLPSLTTNSVTALVATGDGRVYAALTSLGLYAYAPNASGAYSWTNIPASGGTTGPASASINALAVFNGSLWVGTAGSGLSVMNLTSGAWTTYTSASQPKLAGNTINSLTPFTPSSGSPYIWIGTTSGATRYTSGRTPVWSLYTGTNTSGGLAGNYIYDIEVQIVGVTTYTWFSTSNALVRWTGSAWSSYFGGGGCSFGRATQMTVDKSNGLWFGMEEYAPGFAEEDPAAKEPGAPTAGAWFPVGVCRNYGANWSAYDSTSPGLPGSDLTDIGVDGAGRVWMAFNGVSGGGASYDKGRWAIYKTAAEGLATNDVRQVEPIGEAVWFGHNGTATIDIYTPSWDNLTAGNMNGAGTPGPVLIENTTAWVGVGTNLTSYTASWTHRVIVGNSSAVSALARDGAGTLWVGTAGSGLFSYDGISTFTRQTTADGLPSNTITALLKDQQGRLWVATPAGLALRGESYWLRFNTANAPIASDDLTSLTLDSVGRIWAGTAAAGISVFDPRPNGGWTTQTTADGLPSNAIAALLTEPSGAIWAATAAGVARRNPASGAWTSFTQAGGALPNNAALSLAFDGVGTLWVGTGSGLAQYQAGVWTQHHVPGTGLLHDRVRYVGADSKRLWAVSGTTVGVRGPPDVPIGNFAPVITSFTPSQGGPLTEVTITGNYFDNRGPEFNRVTIANDNTVATIISVSTTSMVIKIPIMAQTGKLRVQANGLGSAWSAAVFNVTPVVTDLNATCLGVGSVLELSGYGFTSGNGFYVKIGSGPWRVADYWSPAHAKRVIMPDDTPGAIQVKSGSSGVAVTTPYTFKIPQLSLEEVNIQQGIEDLRMIWGKRTLVQIQPKATGCNARITGGTIYWKKKNGTEVRAGVAYTSSPDGLVVQTDPPKLAVNSSVNFVAEFMSNRSHWEKAFPMSQFDGMRVVLRNGWQDVMTITIPATAFVFVDTAGKREIISMGIYPSSGVNEFDFDSAASAGMRHVARVYPMQDTYWGIWLNMTPIWTSFDYVYLDDDLDDVDENYAEVRDYAADYIDPGGKRQSMALIDYDLYQGGPGGKATVGGSSAVTFNTDWNMASIFLQEAIHNLGSVDDDAPNHDSLNEYHSRYDEGEWDDYGDCVSSLNFRKALEAQMGGVKQVVRLDSGDPYQFSMVGCGDNTKMPKSVMSYVSDDTNESAFLEPIDYNYVLDEICDGECPYSNLFPTGTPVVQAMAATEAITPERTFRLSGAISSNNAVTISLSLVEQPGGTPTPEVAGGLYKLVLRDAGGIVLDSHAFNVGSGHTHGSAPKTNYFQVRMPFPEGAASAELRHDDAILWSDSVSAGVPSVSFVSPSGGSHAADSPVTVSWSASDPDGDELQFALEYSHDGGATWLLLAPRLTGSSFQWLPGYVLASASARLRLRASDGFNTATATSAAFTLSPKAPEAHIDSPTPGQIFTEGQTINLTGSSLSSSGPNAGSFEWLLDGQSIGDGPAISTTLEQVGTFSVTLNVTANGLQGSDVVSITVSPDFDHDGLPNAWEQSHKLNPLDPNNGSGDQDGDGLSTLDEYQLGSSPVDGDSDDDQVPDGAEAEAGSDPSDGADEPSPSPVLQVGAEELGFTVNADQPTPSPWEIWITNGGGGSLTWTAADDASWLALSDTSGSAPSQLTISADATGLVPGSYTGHVTITASGAASSPHTITVTLTVQEAVNKRVYLPLLSHTP